VRETGTSIGTDLAHVAYSNKKVWLVSIEIERAGYVATFELDGSGTENRPTR
jgi:hypothetical protein